MVQPLAFGEGKVCLLGKSERKSSKLIPDAVLVQAGKKLFALKFETEKAFRLEIRKLFEPPGASNHDVSTRPALFVFSFQGSAEICSMRNFKLFFSEKSKVLLENVSRVASQWSDEHKKIHK